VAGVCALVLSANSALSALEVRQILQETADKDLSLETDTDVNEPGNFNENGFSLWFGHGKVNAFRAVQAAAAMVETERFVDLRQDNPKDIPDVGTPVISSINVSESGTITDLRVQVNISHTFIGDLRVDLMAPDGTGVTLHNNTGGSARDLVHTYSVQDSPSLRPLINKPIEGTWQLSVRDTFRLDVGRLNEWRMVARIAA
jgi:subtilisin-like proprotein convertase family protein